jgi:hypothetical protein
MQDAFSIGHAIGYGESKQAYLLNFEDVNFKWNGMTMFRSESDPDQQQSLQSLRVAMAKELGFDPNLGPKRFVVKFCHEEVSVATKNSVIRRAIQDQKIARKLAEEYYYVYDARTQCHDESQIRSQAGYQSDSVIPDSARQHESDNVRLAFLEVHPVIHTATGELGIAENFLEGFVRPGVVRDFARCGFDFKVFKSFARDPRIFSELEAIGVDSDSAVRDLERGIRQFARFQEWAQRERGVYISDPQGMSWGSQKDAQGRRTLYLTDASVKRI